MQTVVLTCVCFVIRSLFHQVLLITRMLSVVSVYHSSLRMHVPPHHPSSSPTIVSRNICAVSVRVFTSSFASKVIIVESVNCRLLSVLSFFLQHHLHQSKVEFVVSIASHHHGHCLQCSSPPPSVERLLVFYE